MRGLFRGKVELEWIHGETETVDWRWIGWQCSGWNTRNGFVYI